MICALSLAIACLIASPTFAADAPRIYNAAILDGQSNHDWKSTTPMIKAALEKRGGLR